MTDTRFYSFVGGGAGIWEVTGIRAVTGAGLETPARLHVSNEDVRELPEGARWCLRGVTSNQRYVTRGEQQSLVAKQDPTGRSGSTRAALIRGARS